MQPQKYERANDFTERDGDDTDHASINAELDAAALTTDQIRENLALIQRDDGALKNGIVTADALDDTAFDAVLINVNVAVTDAQQSATSALTSATTALGARDAAVAAKTTTETARDVTILNANNASSSALAALNSQTAAAASQSDAAVSKVASASSQVAAAASATSASTSATTATTQAGIATTQATNAAASATGVVASATTATTKAGEASTSATGAASSASAASTSATAASNSASVAATSATQAATSASNAGNSATAAATSATSASGSATTAVNAKTGALASQTAAAGSATEAASSATAAAGSATTATTQATTATTQATNAAASAAAAATSVAANYGFFRKTSNSTVAWTKTGAGTAATSSILYIDVNGSIKTILSGASITMPTLVAGTDYAIWAKPDSTLEATSNHTSPPVANARKVGGFHYAPGGHSGAPGGGNTTPGIWAGSFWDLKWRPNCPDQRGMEYWCNSWMDMYLTGVDAITLGSSRYNVAMADGSSPPKVPAIFGGNGSTTYGSYTWFEASELAMAMGKRLPTQREFMAHAYGTTEASSVGADQNSTILNSAYTSAAGLFQATGVLWVWGDDRGGAYNTAGWNASTEGRGSEYNAPYAVLLGGNWTNGSNAGSRCSYWIIAASASLYDIGSRFCCDHLQLD